MESRNIGSLSQRSLICFLIVSDEQVIRAGARRASSTTTRCRRWTLRASEAGGDGARAAISRSACGTSGRRCCASRATLRSHNQQPGGARSEAAQDPAEDFRLLPKRGRRGGPGEPEDDAGDGAHAGLERIGDAGGPARRRLRPS